MIGQSRHICIRDLIMICKNTILNLVIMKVVLKLFEVNTSSDTA